MRMPSLFVLLLLQFSLFAADAPAQIKPQELGWCTVSALPTAAIGSSVDITVTLTKVPDGMAFVSLDLHGRSASADYLGFNSSGGSKSAVLNKPLTWTITVAVQAGLAEVIPTVYLSKNGDYASKGEVVSAAPINVR